LTVRLDIEGMRKKAKQPAKRLNSEQRNQLKVTLLTSSEGRLLLMGVGLTLIYTLWLVVKLVFSPEQSHVLTGVTATGIVFGRAACMAFGYSAGLGHGTVIPICMIIETAFVLIFYPLFVFSWRHLLVIKRLKKTFDRIHKAAETHKDKVQRYGIIGLFAFVWFPFWMTGPAVGCVIGFLLGLRIWVNMTVVLAGTYAAIFGWAFFLRQFHECVASYSPYATVALVVLLVIVIMVGRLLQRTLHENRKKKT
jgi:uncharacterized membrane protein